MTRSSDDRGLYAHRLITGQQVWYVRCQVGGRRRHYGSFTTKSEARAFRDRVKTEARLGRYFPGDASSRLTMEDMVSGYLPTVRARRAYREQARFGAWWMARFAGRRVLSLTAQDLEGAKADLQRARAVGTVNHYLKFLRHVMRIMVRPRAWVLDLWADVPLLPGQPALPTIATPMEERMLYRALGAEADVARLARCLGLRRGQLFGLRWEFVQWRSPSLRIPSFKGQAPRLLPIPVVTVGIVRRRWVAQGRPQTGWLFPDPHDPGKPQDANNWYKRVFVPAAKQTGLYQRGLTFHSLRHTWATRGLEAGVSPRTLQRMGAWSDLKLVERYTHLVDKTIRAGMERAAGNFARNVAK